VLCIAVLTRPVPDLLGGSTERCTAGAHHGHGQRALGAPAGVGRLPRCVFPALALAAPQAELAPLAELRPTAEFPKLHVDDGLFFLNAFERYVPYTPPPLSVDSHAPPTG
jgi:hypothetical protein